MIVFNLYNFTSITKYNMKEIGEFVFSKINIAFEF